MKAKKNPKILVASSECGDWEQLYINGKKGYGNHSLNWRDILQELGIPWEEVEVLENDHEYSEFTELSKDLKRS